jgi:hypothetical protein
VSASELRSADAWTRAHVEAREASDVRRTQVADEQRARRLAQSQKLEPSGIPELDGALKRLPAEYEPSRPRAAQTKLNPNARCICGHARRHHEPSPAGACTAECDCSAFLLAPREPRAEEPHRPKARFRARGEGRRFGGHPPGSARKKTQSFQGLGPIGAISVNMRKV